MTTTHEAALGGLKSFLEGIAWPGAAPAVTRGASEDGSIPPAGHVNVRDGEPGEPEVYMSPSTYGYARRAEIAVLVEIADEAARLARFAALTGAIGQAMAADPTLGGAVELATPEAPEPLDEREAGAATIRAAVVPVVLEYVTASPLG